MIKTERIYNAPAGSGLRILVDRLWPRGLRKDEVKVDLWMKEIAPSNKLRKRFGDDPAKWNGFPDRFFKVLDQKRADGSAHHQGERKAMWSCSMEPKMRNITMQRH